MDNVVIPVTVLYFTAQYLKAQIASAVTDLTAGNVTVADIDNRMGIIFGQIMQDQFTAIAEFILQHV